MKRLYVMFLGLCFCIVSLAQATLQDVVYLKNGSIIRGTIMEQIMGKNIKIATADGSLFVYSAEEVIKITKEAPVTDVPAQTQTMLNTSATPSSTSVAQSVPSNSFSFDDEVVSNNAISTPNSSYNPKSPGLAGFLSFLLVGGGQFYNGEAGKGWRYLGAQIGLGAATSLATGICMACDSYEGAIFASVFGGIMMLCNGIGSMADAVRSAKQLNMQNGYATIQLDNEVSVGFTPTMAYNHPEYSIGIPNDFNVGATFRISF